MSSIRFLTPDDYSLEPVVCVKLHVPQALTVYIRGALARLESEHNWELHGSVAPEVVADKFIEIVSSVEVASSCQGGEMVGTVVLWPLDTIPEGWLVCDGSMYWPNDFPELYAVIGDTYGFIKGRFRLPNYQGNYIRGRNAASDGEITLQHGVSSFDVPGDVVGQHTHDWYAPYDLPSVGVVKWEGSGTQELAAKVAFTPLVPGIKNDLPTEQIDMVPLTKSAHYIIKANE